MVVCLLSWLTFTHLTIRLFASCEPHSCRRSQASSASVPTWQHVHRRVLRELGIEFEPSRHWTRQFLRSLQLSWKLAATRTRARLTLPENGNSCSCIHLCARFGISQDRMEWNCVVFFLREGNDNVSKVSNPR